MAYGACSYLRLVNENGFVHCSFRIGKSRLDPLKTVSIPRLELTAAVLAVKLDSMLRKELKVEITATTFGCDSTAVRQILANSTKRFPTFVANRIATIERIVSPKLASLNFQKCMLQYLQYWLHYLWTLVSPCCRTLTIVLVSLHRTLATSIHLSSAGEKTIEIVTVIVKSFIKINLNQPDKHYKRF